MKRVLQANMTAAYHRKMVGSLSRSLFARPQYEYAGGTANGSSGLTKVASTTNNYSTSSSASQSPTAGSQLGNANPSQSESLPRLPVPALNDTLVKYLRTVQPLLNSEDFEKTKTVVKSFAVDSGIGQKLQSLLEERAKICDNWLSDWWLSTAYLEYRSPVIVWSSPGLVFPTEEFKSKEDQCRYAAKLIYGALQFKSAIDNNTITQDQMGKSPLDMSQYNRIFGTNRNPGKVKDDLVYHNQSRHYVIAYKNYFYKVSAYTENDQIINPAETLRQIKFIVDNTSGLSGMPIGILTSENRDTWGRVYEVFRKDSLNKSSMKAIEEALFLVCIDRPNRPLKTPVSSTNAHDVEDFRKSEKQTIAALQMVHGNRTNSGNRWFDKTVQFIVGSDGECGLTYEHSPSEGPPVAAMSDFVVRNLGTYETWLDSYKEDLPIYTPEKILFNVSDNITTEIASASENLGRLVDDVEMTGFTFKKYGKDFIKTCEFSPDSYIQMAIQCSFHRVHRIPGAHYESASTRMYSGGRTETIRSCSCESLKFSEALNDPKVSIREKYDTMKQAIEGHKSYSGQAVQGFGVDRHLLGLKLIARENGIPIPELYSDKGYAISTHFRLSTSQVPSAHEGFMCYGPLVSDGYGCCYSPRSHDISFGISAFNSDKSTSAREFKAALQEVLLDMQKVSAQSSHSKFQTSPR